MNVHNWDFKDNFVFFSSYVVRKVNMVLIYCIIPAARVTSAANELLMDANVFLVSYCTRTCFVTNWQIGKKLSQSIRSEL